jgi:hypothetical protein
MLIKNLLIKKKKGKNIIFYTCQFEFSMKRERGKFKRIRKLREKGGNIKRKGNIRKKQND